MHRLSFLFSIWFWIPVWVLVLLVGLLPLPPALELAIVVGLIAHVACSVRAHIRGALMAPGQARIEQPARGEYRVQRSPQTLRAESAEPPMHRGLTWH
jgi:hypothetical protein